MTLDNFWKNLSKNDVVVCDNEYLSYFENKFPNQLINFKIINYHDFIKNILGEIDEYAKIALIKKGYNPYYVEKLIDNYFLESNLNINDSRYFNVKELISSYHLFDNVISTYLLEKQIYFINPDYTNNIINLILKKFPNIKQKHIDNESLKVIKAYKCQTLEEEVNNLTILITKELLENPNKQINIYLPDEEYLPYIFRNFDLLHLNYLIDQSPSLFEKEITKRLIDLLDSEKEFKISLINTFINETEPSDDMLKLIEIINSFIKYNPAEYIYFRPLLIEKLQTTLCENKTKANILLHTKLPKIIDNETYYMLGFNQNNIFKSLTDDDFFSDEIKEQYDLKLTKDKNNYLKNNFLRKILSLKEIYISYNTSNHQIPALILEDLKNKVKIEYEDIEQINETQEQYVRYQTGKLLDEFEKNQQINPLLEKIYEEKNLEDYLTYDNTFNAKFKIKTPINLSYTTIDIYNKCRYQYYLKYILHIDDNDSKDNILIGNYFHDLLKKIESKEKKIKDIPYLTNKFLEENNLNQNAIDIYYYQKYEQLLLKVLKYIQEFDKRTIHDEIMYEKEIIKEIDNDTISGRIDKMLIKNDEGISKIIVIDYKTGKTVIDLPLIEYGLSLQIPFYFYLLTNTQNMKIIGGYIQKIMPSKVYEYKEGKDYEDNFKEEYKYNGLTVVEENNLTIIDSAYKEQESIIAGLKFKNDGTFHKSFIDKGLSQEEISLIKAIVEKHIKKTLDDIHEGNFKIDPKMIDNTSTCNYCKYNSICNKKYQDFIHLKKDRELNFLRGYKNDTN